mmetsp:Transcript_971/g.1444  ORF Transcript_971/g.1444 Transcript_971/m.1444 type:complete len:95 (+) Transcript_971:595-879(+)
MIGSQVFHCPLYFIHLVDLESIQYHCFLSSETNRRHSYFCLYFHRASQRVCGVIHQAIVHVEFNRIKCIGQGDEWSEQHDATTTHMPKKTLSPG